MKLLLLRIICFLFKHKLKRYIYRNKLIIYRCARCFKKIKPGQDEYSVRCLVSEKMRSLPLIKENLYTILVGIDNKIIKRHKLKHSVKIT